MMCCHVICIFYICIHLLTFCLLFCFRLLYYSVLNFIKKASLDIGGSDNIDVYTHTLGINHLRYYYGRLYYIDDMKDLEIIDVRSPIVQRSHISAGVQTFDIYGKCHIRENIY